MRCIYSGYNDFAKTRCIFLRYGQTRNYVSRWNLTKCFNICLWVCYSKARQEHSYMFVCFYWFYHLFCFRFLMSFNIDAFGGIMESRQSGVRFIIPRDACKMPTRITCKLRRYESFYKLEFPSQEKRIHWAGKSQLVLICFLCFY